jgi:predicted deacylase
MASKSFMKLPVEDVHNGVKTFIPLGIVEGKEPGPTLAVISGIHATEFVSQDGVMQFWQDLDPEEIAGRVLVVLGADVQAMYAHHMWTNPVDGKGLGKVFPGKKDGTLAEVIAYTLWEEVITKADAVIDCHGGEYSENMEPYVITNIKGDPDLDKRTVDLAMALGVPFVEVVDVATSWWGRGNLRGETCLSGRPAMVMEIGERGERNPRYIAAVYQALQNALMHLSMKAGEPVQWAGQPVRFTQGLILRAKSEGLWEPAVVVGQWIGKDAVFGRVRDFDGTLVEEIRAPAAGVVLTVVNARCIESDQGESRLQGFAGKIAAIGNGMDA